MHIYKARTCSKRRSFDLVYRYQIKEKYKQMIGKKGFLILYKRIMASTSTIRQQTVHTICQLSSPSCSTRAKQKLLPLKGKMLETFLERKIGRMTH